MAKAEDSDEDHKALVEDIEYMSMGEKLERLRGLKDKYNQLLETKQARCWGWLV